jgi:NADH-quinone oxidoreductase subunit L
MENLLWIIPAAPLAGFLVLSLAGGSLRKGHIAVVGTGSVLVSAVMSELASTALLSSHPEGGAFVSTVWRWVAVGGFEPSITFYFDRLSMVMVLVVSWVGLFIHLYSAEYMRDEEGYGRFFAYMNLFVGSMLVLVLAGDLIPLYAGWEGVGLCSYLLIGFWYEDPANGRAARKAFIVTRVGDAAMAVGLFLLFTSLGTLDIQELMRSAAANWTPGSALAVAAAALFLAGAVGKSAQLPLQVWLPDAMAGPTPVSALIHAATMVTAGVYLIARTNVLFTLAPQVQALVAALGLTTLLIASFSALVQRDIKRVLAYSTISQIGYMFLALGVGAYSAAIFHFMTHAFFKALLFLAAGVVIQALGHERDMFKMGGLRREIPLAFWTFLAGAASLSALPLLTAGYYSKDLILLDAFSSEKGGTWLWAGGLAGAFLTSLYAFRMVFLTFFGEAKASVRRRPGSPVKLSLVILAAFALGGGFIDVPGMFRGDPLVFPRLATRQLEDSSHWLLGAIAAFASVSGIALAYWLYVRERGAAARLARNPLGAALGRLLAGGWGFDWLYDTTIVRPFLWAARVNKDDFVDLVYGGMAWYSRAMNGALSWTQSGRMRSYAIGIVLGAVVAVGIVIFI